ncbi:MAG: hypothetical protein Q9181_007264, partial [Wetmoreana brouardii]
MPAAVHDTKAVEGEIRNSADVQGICLREEEWHEEGDEGEHQRLDKCFLSWFFESGPGDERADLRSGVRGWSSNVAIAMVPKPTKAIICTAQPNPMVSNILRIMIVLITPLVFHQSVDYAPLGSTSPKKGGTESLHTNTTTARSHFCRKSAFGRQEGHHNSYTRREEAPTTQFDADALCEEYL